PPLRTYHPHPTMRYATPPTQPTRTPSPSPALHPNVVQHQTPSSNPPDEHMHPMNHHLTQPAAPPHNHPTSFPEGPPARPP
ncbi:hypothetical protein BDK51DRAFT_21601, partial [Blyttiomyces helicus]